MKRISERVGEILVVAITGVMTAGEVGRAIGFLEDELHARDARAVVVDARGAVVLMDAPQWRQALLPSAASIVSRVPLCYVVSPVYEAQAEQRCWALAERGMVRSVFTSLPPALVWASRRREHWPAAPPAASRWAAAS